jgi:outer membrane assembly lipoprotein YfiO
MNRGLLRMLGVAVGLLALPQRAPAPLIYTPGEGWHYEAVGAEGAWRRGRAEDQLAVAQSAFQRRDYSLALKAARRTVSEWPTSKFAGPAQYLVGRCYEAKGLDEKAFTAYQKLLTRYPKADHFEEVLKRQFLIANRYLAGQWFKVLTYVPFFPSMDRTIKMYEQLIRTGPYSEVAPQSQLNIGEAHERKMALWIPVPDYPAAARAFEKAADRYADQKAGVDGLYRLGLAHSKQAKRAEYDQSVASQAIATFSDFVAMNPDEPRVPQVQQLMDSLKTEQARGSFEIARFYENNRKWQAAKIYYNEALLRDPGSRYADEARRRIDAINRFAR